MNYTSSALRHVCFSIRCMCVQETPRGCSFHRSHLQSGGPTGPPAYCVCVCVCESVCVFVCSMGHGDFNSCNQSCAVIAFVAINHRVLSFRMKIPPLKSTEIKCKGGSVCVFVCVCVCLCVCVCPGNAEWEVGKTKLDAGNGKWETERA